MDMDIDDIVRQLNIIAEDEKEQRLWERWIPYQSQMAYDEFKMHVTSPTAKRDERSVEEILSHVQKLMDKYRGDALSSFSN